MSCRLCYLLLALAFSLPGPAAEPFTAAELENLNFQIRIRASGQSVMAQYFPDSVVPRLLRFSNGKRVGYMDLSGRIVVPPVFDGAHDFNHGKLPARLDGKWGYLDHTGTLAIELKYEEVAVVWQPPLTARLNGRWGLLDESGQWVVEPVYEELRIGNKAYEFRKDKKWGVMSRSGEILIPAKFDGIDSSPTTSHIAVQVGRRWRIADRSGKLIGEAEYERIHLYDPGLAIVQRGSQQEMIEIPSQAPLPLRHDEIFPTQDRQRWIVKTKGLYGVSDREGNAIIRQEYSLIGTRGARHFDVSNGSMHALANFDGEFLTDFAFEQLGYFEDGLIQARIGGKWGYIDTSGKVVIEPRFSSVSAFLQGLAPVSVDKKYGYIGKDGTFVIAPKFEDAYGFLPDGIATVKLDGQYIYIDRKGRKIGNLLQPEVPTAETFSFNNRPER